MPDHSDWKFSDPSRPRQFSAPRDPGGVATFWRPATPATPRPCQPCPPHTHNYLIATHPSSPHPTPHPPPHPNPTQPNPPPLGPQSSSCVLIAAPRTLRRWVRGPVFVSLRPGTLPPLPPQPPPPPTPPTPPPPPLPLHPSHQLSLIRFTLALFSPFLHFRVSDASVMLSFTWQEDVVASTGADVRSQDSEHGIQITSSQDGDGHSSLPADPSASQVCEWGNGENICVLLSLFSL